MMGETLVWLRWLQFIDLGLVFGAALTARLLGRRVASSWGRPVLGLGCMLGLALGAGEFAFILARMAAQPVADLDGEMVSMMLTDTALGWAVMARAAFLMLALGVIALRRDTPLLAVAALGGLATACLAWGGHGAASMGFASVVRLGGDMAHLWAGLTWLGALLLFTALVWSSGANDRTALARLGRQLGGFALIGTVLVGVLVLSGLANLLFLAPPGQWAVMAAAPYGRLLLTKLGLFGAMFVLAGHNRFHLVPALEQAIDPRARHRALAALRRSVTLETLLALGVIWCIAAAGTMDPMGDPMGAA
ncbi:copper homeostasis membrane protein CopD [Novosphingobium sp. KACC 22771]|uniref:copper homeostasis membrane protein CopD n=1 Tax=Novosphingobium sp. KACC 22771 TaxID=3025670 RepID=UPI00236695BC|nr:copper homeostasis membrane protein CopD [Novosphingobium sp. KACC 22771]WDF74021.1 copper homeostasis membrane protein CopD [Novosphingobium sp. KACC 22771]